MADFDPLDFSSYTPAWAGGEGTTSSPTKPDDIVGIIEQAAERYNVPAAVLLSMAQTESSLNPNAIGPQTKYGRAKGLFQYIDDTAERMGIDALDPVQSADAAAKQMSERIQTKGLAWAVAAHHAGDNPRQHGPVTVGYVEKVLGGAGALDEYIQQDTDSPTAATPDNPLDFSSYQPDWVGDLTQPAPRTVTEMPGMTINAPEEEGYWAERREFLDQQLQEIKNMGRNLFGHGVLSSANLELDDAVADPTGKELSFVENARMAARFGIVRDTSVQDLAERQQRVAEARADIKEYTPVVEEAEAALGGSGSLASRVSRVAGSAVPTLPEQVLPVVGATVGGSLGSAAGPGGTAAGGIAGSMIGTAPLVKITYRQAYREALEQFGANEEEANNYAIANAAIEFGSEAVGGKLEAGAIAALGLKTMTKDAAKKGLATLVRSRLARTAGAATIESITEAGTELGQDALRSAMEETDYLSTPEARQKLATYNAQMAETRLSRVLDAGAGGFMIGGGIAAPMAHVAVAVEQGKQQADTIEATVNTSLAEKVMADRARAVQDKKDDNVTLASKREEDRIAQEKAKEDAFTQAEKARAEQEAATLRQKEVEQEAGFRTIEQMRSVEGQTRLDKYGPGDLERVPINPPAEVTPEAVQAEREQAEAAEAERKKRVELGQRVEFLRKRQQAQVDKAATKKDKEEKAARTAEGQLRRDVADKLVEENPGADPATLEPLFNQRLAEAKAAAKPPVAGRKKGKPVKVPRQPAAPTTAPATPKTAEDAELDEVFEKLGLNDPALDMAGDTSRPDNAEPFVNRATRLVKALVKHNTKQSAGVQNLLRQGKLVIAPNAKWLNRKDKGAASYDPNTGKMYLYLDHTNPDDAIATVIRAVHESGHFGQDNTRTDRDAIFNSMLGDKGENEAKRIIMSAYRKGNKLATAAVTKATQAGMNRMAQTNGDPAFKEAVGRHVANHELITYFAGEVAERRQGFGQLTGLVQDIKSAARKYLRKAGMDLDVSFDDLVSASQGFIEEAVNTDSKPSKKGTTLDMFAGEQATDFQTAKDFGKTFNMPKDDKERFEFSDHKAKLEPDGFKKLHANAYLDGEPHLLGDILDHAELYRNYPKAASAIAVEMDENLPIGAEGQLDGNTIRLHPATLLSGSGHVKSILIHEIQHWIQDQEGFSPGTASEVYVPRSVQAKANDANRKVSNFLNKFEIAHAIGTLRVPERNEWLKMSAEAAQGNKDLLSDMSAMSKLFLESGFGDMSRDDSVRTQARRYAALRDDARSAKAVLDRAESHAFDIYRRTQGETEARNTQRRMNFTPEEREAVHRTTTQDVQDSNLVTPDEFNADGSTVRGSEQPAGYQIMDTSTGLPVDTAVDLKEAIQKVEQLGGSTKAWAKKVRTAPAVSLDMATDGEAVDLPFTRRIPAVISGLLSSSGGVGRKGRNIMEYALSSPSSARMIAEGIAGRYRDAIAELAAQKGVTPQKLNEEIIAAIDSVDKKSDSYSENLEAFKAVVRPYGKAGEALLEFRSQVDELSKGMLKERAAQGTPLSDAERTVYQTIRANLGRYAHRQYAINMSDVGQRWAKDVWKDYNEFVKKNGEVNEGVKKNYARVANAVKRLIDEELVIPSDERLNEMSDATVKRMFSVWGGKTNIDAYSVEQMRDELSNIRDQINEDKDRLNQTAEEIVQQILGLATPTSTVSKYYRGGKIDKSILKERGDIAPVIRELMGEIKDPAARLLATVAKQAEFIARSRMLLELKNMNEPAHLQPPSATGTPAVKGMTKLEGDNYGPLENHYVSKNLYNMLSDHIQQLATFEQAVAMAAARTDVLTTLATSRVVKGWGKIAGVSKMSQIVLNPINFLYNFMGGPLTMMTNGNLNPKHIAKAMKTAADIIAYSTNPAKNTEESRRVTTAGVTDSAFVGEISAGLHKDIVRVVNEMKGKSHTDMWHAATKLGLSFKELYAMMDVVYKIADFYQQADAVLPEYYKAQGVNKTQEEIDREAADITNDTHVTYKRAAPIVKAVEKVGLSNFGVFFYEVFRSQMNNLKQGFKELARAKSTENPKAAAIMAAQGSRRLLGQLTTWAMLGAVSRMAARIAFGDDEDKERKLRALLPDYMQNQDFIPLGKDNEGRDVLFQLSRIDPAGPMTDIMRSALNNDADLNALTHNILQLYVAPRVGVRLFDALAQASGLKQEKVQSPLVQELFPRTFGGVLAIGKALTIENRTTKAWTLVGETFMPGVVNSWRESNARPIVENPADAAVWAMTYSGSRMYKLDGKAALSTAAFDYKDLLADNRKILTELFQDQPDLTESQLLSNVLDLREQEKESYDKLRAVYEGLQATDTPASEITARLKTIGLPAPLIRSVRSGDFRFSTVSRKSLNEYERRELSTTSRAERAKVREKWKHVKDMLDSVVDTMEEEQN